MGRMSIGWRRATEKLTPWITKLNGGDHAEQIEME